MKDLYDIFTATERGSRTYRHPDSEDNGLSFDKVLEIAEQEEGESPFEDE